MRQKLNLLSGGPGCWVPSYLRPVGIVRTVLVERKWWSLYKHEILRPDIKRSVPHSHPATLISLCIKGGYVESLHEAGKKDRVRKHRRFLPYLFTTTKHHKFIEVLPGTVTYCLILGNTTKTSTVWIDGKAVPTWTREGGALLEPAFLRAMKESDENLQDK